MYIITTSKSSTNNRNFYLEKNNLFIPRGYISSWGECYPAKTNYNNKIAKALYLLTEKSYFDKCYRILVKNADM